MLHRRVISSVSIILALMVFAACSNNSSTNSNSQEKAMILGRVTDDAGYSKTLAKTNDSIEGAVVTVTRVNADGSVETVSDNSVQTNENGEFTIETEADGETGLIVKAVKNNSEWKAVVSSMVEAGNTTECRPLTEESTVEAEVEEETKPRRSNGNSTTSYVDIAAIIDADIAEKVKGNSTAITELALAIDAEVEAYNEAMTSTYIGENQSSLDAAANSRLKAQEELEIMLYSASGDDNSINAAYESYLDAMAEAYLDANISLTSHAKATAISSETLINNTSSMSGEVSFLVEKSTNSKKAKATGRACEEQFMTMGATSTQLGTIVNAKVDLIASINSSNTRSDIEAAFETYHDIIINELKISSGTNANAITTIDTGINGLLGAKVVLDTSLNTSISTEAVINAYIEFYNSVRALVEATLIGASESEINTTTEILVLANISA